MKLIRYVAGAALLVGASVSAYAAGMFTNLPIVGGAAYCALLAGDGVTCSGNVPAGPTVLTGNEKIPADTLLPSGQSPQTVYLDISTLGAGPTQYSVPLTGATIAVAAGTRQVILDPAGTLAALTLTLAPATALTEGQRLGVCSSQVVTSLTITPGSGSTVSNTVTALAIPPGTGAGTCYEWVYVASVSKWLRSQ